MTDKEMPENIAAAAAFVEKVLQSMATVVVGQEEMTRSLVMGLLSGGHILLEGLPGLAKTLSVKTLASVLDVTFQRIQFTPDLLPSDLIGTLVYQQATGEFVPRKGPIFTHLLLADEINRAPAKVQSALLEAMAEEQITLGDKTYPLEKPFLVLATQNPIEQDGTYNLPEAQLDRFLFKVRVDYPSRDEERTMLSRLSSGERARPPHSFSAVDVLEARRAVHSVYCDKRIEEYVLRLVHATRPRSPLGTEEAPPEILRELRKGILVGASPRASLALVRAGKANALMESRHFVIPEDIKRISKNVLRHRILLGYEAQADGVDVESLIERLLDTVTVP